jgi:hypothetical protein
MKKFIQKLLSFLIFPTIIGGAVFLVFVICISNLSSECQIKSNIKHVYIGDSHIEQTINDSIIPNSLNIGINSESFYFSYYKLEVLLNNNPSIDNIYLGFSYHNLSNYYDRFINGDYSYSIAPKYFYILPPKQQIRMIYWNKTNLVPFMRSVIKHGFIKLLRNDCSSFLGGYSNNFKSTTAVNSSIDKRLTFQYYNNGSLNPFSKMNIEYLNKIVLLCKSKDIKLYAISTPLYSYYIEKVPEGYKEKLQEIISESQINYIDLSNLEFKREYFIPDGDHVSKLGAEATSVELNKARTHNNVYKK